jgi:hypothetical protein
MIGSLVTPIAEFERQFPPSEANIHPLWRAQVRHDPAHAAIPRSATR